MFERLWNMKKLDFIMLLLFLVALLVISFFWKCHYDPIVTALGILIAVVSGLTTLVQYKKIKELSSEETQ